MKKAKANLLNSTNNPEVQNLKKTIKENKDKRMHIRYMVIYHHLEGYTNLEIAVIENICNHTVGKYINSYKEQGLEGLVMGKSSGAPRFLTIEQEKALLEVIITKTPDEVGFPNRKNWDCNIACQWVLSNFNIKYSQRGMLQVLHRHNLSYTRPTYTLAKADPIKQENFKQEFEVLKKSD
jgi:putative transposase